MNGREEQESGKRRAGAATPLIAVNDRERVIRHRGHGKAPELLRRVLLKCCPSPVIDRETLRIVQVLRLHEAIDRTETCTGSAALLRALVQPGTDPVSIRARQDALREIASDDKLRRALTDVVHEYGLGEGALFRFFNKGIPASFPYPDVKRARLAAAGIARMLPDLPTAGSPFLKDLVSRLRDHRGSVVDRMMRGAIHRTFDGLKPDAAVGPLTPKLTFIPRRFTHWMLAGPAVALAPRLQALAGFEPIPSSALLHAGLAWTGIYLFYALFVKPVTDTERFIEPLRRQCVEDRGFGRAVDAIGMIDVLLSCHRFARESPYATVLPEITDADRHRFEATGLRNPATAGSTPGFVPNDVNLNGARLTFLSGPNSGGKTTLCKGIVHTQLLAQMGSYVLAERAAVSIADRIRYQAPAFDSLQDSEGRFGTELGRTRDIFFAASPRSLVILDELAEGTTHEETLTEAFDILSDFHAIGNTTVLVTHNHTLADRFADARTGQCFQMAFDGENPTYRIVPGIARTSNAHRIAAKIGFSKGDRHRHLKDKGYI